MSKRDAAIYRKAAAMIGMRFASPQCMYKISLATLAIRYAANEMTKRAPRREAFVRALGNEMYWDDDAVTALCFMAAMAEAGDA